MIRLLLADDHQLFREGLRSLLAAESDIELAGSAADGAEAVKMALELRPDVVLMDVTMPNLNGIAAAAKIHAANPNIKIAIISMHSDMRYIAEALKAGARGYLLKEISPSLMLEAVHSINEGQIFLSPKACTALVEDYLRMLGSADAAGSNPLSEREMEVLKLLVKGYSGKQTADYLSISKNTVDTHRRRIMDKLGCNSMAELTKYAIREGFLTLE